MRIVLLTALFLFTAPARTRAQEPVASADGIDFHASFLVNLHLTLYGVARSGLPPGPGLPRIGGMPSEPLRGDPTPSERRTWDAAVAFYQQDLARRSLFNGEGMTELHWALSKSGDSPNASAAIPDALRAHLEATAPIFRRYWWAEERDAIHEWIDDVAARIRDGGPRVSERLTALLDTVWFEAPVRAEITFYGRAYTTLEPEPLTMIAVIDPEYSGWAGAEMTFHEVAHALIAPLQRRIEREAAAAGKQPGDLWHAVQFYLVGELWRATLADRGIVYVPYMEVNRLFDFDWSPFREPIESSMRPYLEGRIDTETAVRRLVEGLPGG